MQELKQTMLTKTLFFAGFISKLLTVILGLYSENNGRFERKYLHLIFRPLILSVELKLGLEIVGIYVFIFGKVCARLEISTV